jgi:glycosyltransferase involved in cell wall biosynthesis
MKNVLILQNEIMAYRKAIYNTLTKRFNLTIIHSGKISKKNTDSYHEIIVPKSKIGSFILQKNVFTEIKQGNYDVIIAMFDLHWIKNILLLFFLCKTPVIFWGHRYGKNAIINSIRNSLLKKSGAAILYNDSEIVKMVQSGIARNKIFVAENTIHVENYEDCSQYPKSSFLYVGRAQKRKKVDELIRAFAQIIDEIPDHITIDIVGEGEENESLKVLAGKLKVKERVIFHGSITDNNRLKELFKKAFAYVSPDAIGLGAQHSFAYGVPVITIANGFKGAEFDKLNHNENAILYNSHNELKDILLKLISNVEFRKRLGKNAYNLYKNKLTIDNMAQGFIDAIEYVSK